MSLGVSPFSSLQLIRVMFRFFFTEFLPQFLLLLKEHPDLIHVQSVVSEHIVEGP